MYYSESEARKLVIEAGRRLLGRGLVTGTWGNISARISEDSFVITPDGLSCEDLSEEDLVVVGTDCSHESEKKPSSEKGIHADAYAIRSDVKFIIHTHQYYASVVAADCRNTDPAPCAEYGLPGTGRLRRNMKTCIMDHPDKKAFLMARHGALILGEDPDGAFGLAAGLEESCRILVGERVTEREAVRTADFDADRIAIRDMPHVRIADDPYVMECCNAGVSLRAYVDDFAQMIGPDIHVISGDEEEAERVLLGYSPRPAVKLPEAMPMTGALDRMGGQQPALNSFIGRCAVLVKGVGAVCIGRTEEDAAAAASICSKNCAAACYVRYARPLNAFDARLQRYLYLAKFLKITAE